DGVAGGEFLANRRLDRAARHRHRAARVEMAAGGWMDRVWHLAFETDAPALRRRVGDWHRRQEGLRIGMLGRGVKIAGRGGLDGLKEVDDALLELARAGRELMDGQRFADDRADFHPRVE